MVGKVHILQALWCNRCYIALQHLPLLHQIYSYERNLLDYWIYKRIRMFHLYQIPPLYLTPCTSCHSLSLLFRRTGQLLLLSYMFSLSCAWVKSASKLQKYIRIYGAWWFFKKITQNICWKYSFFCIGDNCLQRECKHCWDKIISMMLSDVSFSDTHIVKIVPKLSFLYIASQYIVAHILLRIPKSENCLLFPC